MNYNIKGTELEITPELRSYIERRLYHAEKFLSSDPSAHVAVELEYSAVRDGGAYRAEFTVSASGQVYRASQWAGAMHEAIDIAVDNLANELRRGKKKRLHLFRHTGARVKEYLRGWRDKI